MNRTWNKDIHDRLKDFPKKAPEGLLDDIKLEMLRRGLTPAPVAPKRPAVFLRIASVAAMILVLLGISYLFQWKEPALLPAGEEIASLPIVKADTEPAQVEVPVSIPVVPSVSRQVAQVPKDTVAQTPEVTIVQTDTLLVVEKDTVSSVKRPQEETSPSAPVHQRTRWTYAPQKRKKASYDVGIYYSGLIAQVDMSKKGEMIEAFPMGPFDNMPVPPSDDPDGGNMEEGNDSTAVASRLASRSFSRKKGYEKAEHHLPVRLGVSFRYYLNEQWNIQSGLTYSYLASDLSYNSPSVSYKTKQKLHYIGIPLQVGLRIWEGERFRGYLSAGGQVEKLVSGKATTRYTMESRSTGTLVENISDKKLLFSALASIGVECMLGKDLSLYAEPGFHYYFKNGNGLQTHYNEQPLNFNITIGFRFHWKK